MPCAPLGWTSARWWSSSLCNQHGSSFYGVTVREYCLPWHLAELDEKQVYVRQLVLHYSPRHAERRGLDPGQLRQMAAALQG
jgi:hypothetical protein